MTTVIFDIDGVLADNSNYESWFIDGKFYHTLFAKDISSLKVNRWAYELLDVLIAMDYNIVLITARREAFKEATIKWLDNNNIIYDEIHFNNGKDQVTHKLRAISNYDDVLFIIEDSPELVKAYREAGYIVLQPNHLFEENTERKIE